MKKVILILAIIVPLTFSCSREGIQNMGQFTDTMYENGAIPSSAVVIENMILFLDVNVNNWMVNGVLSNLTVNDFGENNSIMGKTNTNHANGTLDRDFASFRESGRNSLLQYLDK